MSPKRVFPIMAVTAACALGTVPVASASTDVQTAERLGPDDLKAVVGAYRDALRQHQESINRLNVYPVPDGDTSA